MKAISLLFISIFISASSLSFSARHDTAQKYNASMSETSVQNLFDGLIDNQDDVFLNNYSTVYFSHLNENFPINSNGTCSATALSMLLSFYDSYWDDDLRLYAETYYHWYRQNPDGTWSHKPSGGDVRDYDFDGNPIYDPEFCNRKSHLNPNQEKLGIYDHDYYSEIYFFKVQGFHLGV